MIANYRDVHVNGLYTGHYESVTIYESGLIVLSTSGERKFVHNYSYATVSGGAYTGTSIYIG